MSTPKRAYKDVDPDYTDACEQQAKRQKELEQDAKHNVGRRIQGIVRSEFRKEINNKELELHQVDRKLNEARLMMDRLRACIISTYYGQINQSGTSEVPKMSGPPSSIHPTVKKHLGKRPPHHELHSDFKLGLIQPYSRPELLFNECMESVHERSDSRYQQNKTPVHQPPVSVAVSDTSPYTAQEVPLSEITYDDRRARLKIKKKIIVGNVSKYIPVDHREANDKSSHKWMVYVRGPKLEPDISGFVKKVWFFLHHSYKPNDLVEIRCPPFHLTRRGWGEFPVRVQLHFVDPRNKKVDIIHQLKLDKTFSGLQSLGAETTVELDLERDFFGPDTCNNSCYMRPTIDDFSTCNHASTYGSSSSGLHAPKITSSCHFICSQSDTLLPEQSPIFQESETDKTNSESVREVLDSSCGVQSTRNKFDNCLVEICDMSQPSLQVELETVKLGNSVQSLGEYNVTIIHETEKCADRKQTGQTLVSVMLNDRQTEKENSISSAVAPDLHTCASSQKVQSASVNAPLTVIHKPQWIHPDTQPKGGCPQAAGSITNQPTNPDTPHTTERPASFPLQISQPSELDMHCCDTSKILADVNAAKKVKCRSEAVSVTSIEQNFKLSFDDQISKIDPSNQSRNSELLTENELCLNPSSISTSAKQMCLSVPSSSSPVSVLPISSMVKVVRAQISGCGRSSPHVSLPVSQITAYTTSDSTQFTSEPCVLPLSQEVLRVKENPSPCMSDVQKVIIIQPHSSSNMPEVVSTNAAGVEDKTLLQSKPSGPRQVSLLTGRIFSPQTTSSSMTKMSSSSHSSSESVLASTCEAVKQTPNQTAALGNYARERTKCGPQVGGPLLLIKTLNHLSLSVPPAASHLLCQSSTVTGQITNMNGSVMPGLSSQLESVSMANAGGSADSPVSFMSHSGVLKTQAFQNRQMNVSRTDTVLNVCGQDQSHAINGQDCSAYPKMSAIGMTKFGRNTATMLTPNVSSKSTTDEERKRNQYEVLMAWKRNRLLLEKGKQVVKIPRDNIEGEADIIPELNLDDYTSLRALLKAAVQLHPLVEADVNKLTHPYCAESLEVWLSWTLGKQLASEWHRACFVLKYLKPLLGKSESFRGEQLMTTRQLVRWCRLHAFSPLTAVVKRKPEDADVNSKPPQNICHNSSLTHADTLRVDLLAESAVCQPQVSSGCDESVLEVVNDTERKTLGTIKMTNTVQNSGDDNFNQDCLEPSDGALFIFDELRKRGLRLHASELQPGLMSYTAADMLCTAMQEFLADILRETVAVNASLSSQSAAVDITRKDVHQALSQLPEAAFSCNKFLGKTDGAIDGSGR